VEGESKLADMLGWAWNYLGEHGLSSSRLDAELILGHLLGINRMGIYLDPSASLAKDQADAFVNLIHRRTAHFPVQYIIGTQEFMSLKFEVNRDVFIPRPETEILVETVLEKFQIPDTRYQIPVEACTGFRHQVSGIQHPASIIVDLGTGCGNIAIALARAMANSFIYACDISGPALYVARANSRIHRVNDKVFFLWGDLSEPLNGYCLEGRADVVVSNPPYVRTEDIRLLPEEVKNFEPHLALDGGIEGLDFHLKIVSQAPKYLKPGGWIALELGAGQADRVKEIIKNAGVFNEPEIIMDYSGIERVIIASRK
jgi:release factor glutamine methyltransferase